jgi:hypothetical protein
VNAGARAYTAHEIVILSEAKDLLSCAPKRKQVLRFAQDDNFFQIERQKLGPELDRK